MVCDMLSVWSEEQKLYILCRLEIYGKIGGNILEICW